MDKPDKQLVSNYVAGVYRNLRALSDVFTGMKERDPVRHQLAKIWEDLGYASDDLSDTLGRM